MRKKLTERQQMIYDFIAETIRSRVAPPTIREIMDVFEISSTNGVRTTLAALEKKGHIRRRSVGPPSTRQLAPAEGGDAHEHAAALRKDGRIEHKGDGAAAAAVARGLTLPRLDVWWNDG